MQVVCRRQNAFLKAFGAIEAAVHGLCWLVLVPRCPASKMVCGCGQRTFYFQSAFLSGSDSTSISWCTDTAGGATSLMCKALVLHQNPSMKADTHSRGMRCCGHGDLPVLSGFKNCKESKSEIAWTLLNLQELHVALS